MFKFRIYPWNSKTTLQLCSHSTGYLFVEPYKALRYGMDSNGPRRHKSFTQIEHRAGAVGRKDLVPLIPVLSPEYLLLSQWVPVLAPTYEADLATERERHLTTGKRAEGLNSTSGAQFAALPLVKSVVWFARAVFNWRSCSVTKSAYLLPWRAEWVFTLHQSLAQNPSVTLHFHRNRASATVLVCEERHYLVWFSWQSYPALCKDRKFTTKVPERGPLVLLILYSHCTSWGILCIPFRTTLIRQLQTFSFYSNLSISRSF